jgi:hypothetical protein
LENGVVVIAAVDVDGAVRLWNLDTLLMVGQQQQQRLRVRLPHSYEENCRFVLDQSVPVIIRDGTSTLSVSVTASWLAVASESAPSSEREPYEFDPTYSFGKVRSSAPVTASMAQLRKKASSTDCLQDRRGMGIHNLTTTNTDRTLATMINESKSPVRNHLKVKKNSLFEIVSLVPRERRLNSKQLQVHPSTSVYPREIFNFLTDCFLRLTHHNIHLTRHMNCPPYIHSLFLIAMMLFLRGTAPLYGDFFSVYRKALVPSQILSLAACTRLNPICGRGFP